MADEACQILADFNDCISLLENPMTFAETEGQGCPYLHQEDDEKIKVGYSSELFKQVLRYEVPKCVLYKAKARIGHFLLCPST